MNNDTLVELVKNQKFYLIHKSQRDEKVLEAMREVDRVNFLGQEPIDLYDFDGHEFCKMEKMLINKEIHSKSEMDEIKGYLKHVLVSLSVVNVYARDLAYNDTALPIGNDQTCSQPSMVGFMADILELEQGMKVLEVGAGCGYHAAVTAHLIGESGYLYTIEIMPELANLAKKNLANHFGINKVKQRLEVICGDGSMGLRQEATFDRIYLTAGVNSGSFDPLILEKQLKPNGILLFPEEEGAIIKERYDNGIKVETKQYKGVSFVPLKGKNS